MIPCASTRVGSKHIPEMIIPYLPVTEVYTGCLLCGGFDSNDKACNEWLTGIFIVSMFSAFLTDSMHIKKNFLIGSSDKYDVFMSASTTEIAKPS